MSFQPPPPGNTPPPPPPPGAPGPSGSFDPKSVNTLDWGILGAGVLAFLFSFIDYYDGADVTAGGRSATVDGSASAWHDVFGGGFFNWFAMLFAILGSAALAISLFAPQVKLPLAPRLAALAGYGIAAVFVIIGIFVTPGDSGGGALYGGSFDVSLNHGFGFWVSLIVILAGTVLSLMRAQQTNTALPGPLNKVPRIGA